VAPCRRVIEQVMQNLKGTPAEGAVSYADLIALGGAYAVSATGGPTIDVPIGQPTHSLAIFALGRCALLQL
jgi:L-ascorbate peroxidase